jgi:hypothetical protein
MNYACPNLECSQGRVYDRNGVNGSLPCQICAGRGFIASSLPVPPEVKLVASDLGFTRNANWRPMDGTGSLHGLPVSGKAVATDGVLIVLELASGQRFVGHLDNFLRDKKSTTSQGKQSKMDVNEGMFE